MMLTASQPTTRLPVTLGWILLCAVTAQAAEKPNIIFTLVDDQGYYDLGCYSATEVQTPRIDAMARQGVRFADYYAAAPICSPSRVGRVIDGRDISPLLKGKVDNMPSPTCGRGVRQTLMSACWL